MATKIKDNVLEIFWNSTKFYFSNFGNFFRYMAFPVFGQIIGIILILSASYFYTSNLPKWIVQGGIFDNFSMIFFVFFLIIFPGLFVLIKAFWDYLVAYGAVNSMLDNMLKSGHVYDFHAHTELISRRSAAFGALWLLLAVFGLVGSFPLLWVIAGILSVYFVLIFQVFTYEPDKSPLGCFKKSFEIIKGNFWKTILLMILIGIFNYWIFPEAVKAFCNFVNIVAFLVIPFDILAKQLPIDSINEMLLKTPVAYQVSSLVIAKFIIDFFLGYIVTSLILPWRVICWGLWYKALNKGEVKLDKKILERAEAKD